MLKNLEHASEKERFMTWCLIQCIEAENLDVDIKTLNNEDYMCENPIKLLLKIEKQTYRLTIKAKGLLYAYYGKWINKSTPADLQHGREPDKVKPLVQYLDEYIECEIEIGNIRPAVSDLFAYNSWRELLEQALDAYQSTENVTIKIERV